MRVKPSSPPNGSELLVLNKDGKTLYVNRTQVAAILASTGVRSRPFRSLLTERTGTETYRAVQGGVLVEFTLAELTAYLAGTATPDPIPFGRQLDVYSGTERFVGRQGTGVFASDIMQTLYVRGLGGSLEGLGGNFPGGGTVTPTPTPTPTPGALTPYTLNARTLSYSQTAGSTATPNRLNTHNWLMNRLDAPRRSVPTITPLLKGLYLRGDSEAQWLANHIDSTKPMTKVGAPTYSLAGGAGGFTPTDYYETSIPLSALSQNNTSIGYYSLTGGNSSNPDMGVLDTTASVLIFAITTTNSKPSFRIFNAANAQPAGSASYWNGTGWHGFSRLAADSLRLGHHGPTLATATSTSAAPTTPAATISLGWAKGAASASIRSTGGAYIADGLSEAQEAELTAALNDYDWSVRWGDPFIYPVGVGPAAITAQVVVYGCSLSGLITAYHYARLGFSVAMVGGWADENVWDIGGMVSNGLDFIDAAVPSHVKGIVRDMITFGNVTVLARADTTSQAGLSIDARTWQAVIRRMLDPSRVAGSQGSNLLPGMDIKVYMTGGIVSAAKTGDKITSITTVDGRTFTGSQFVEAGYDGDLVRLTVPFATGRGAATAGEPGGGYRATGILKPQTGAGGTQLTVDPYITPGNSASGRIFGVIADPGIADGAEDPNGLQPLNKRMTWSSSLARYAPFSTASSPPPGYDAAKYEIFGRMFAAATAAGTTIAIGSLFKIDSTSGTLFDVNNGEARISTDLPNSGLEQHAAGANYALRRALFSNVESWITGMLHWLLFSGDSRIPAALVTALSAYGFDPLCHSDPGSGVSRYGQPKNAYLREPFAMMRNAGYVFETADMATTDGTTPRSTKTATTTAYAIDLHPVRTMDQGGAVVIQGAVYNSSASVAGGANGITPFPLDGLAPDAASCTNLLSITAPSIGRLAYGSYRMEPTMGMAGEFAAQVARQAINDNTSVQAVDYSAVRAALIPSTPIDNTPLTLPQVN